MTKFVKRKSKKLASKPFKGVKKTGKNAEIATRISAYNILRSVVMKSQQLDHAVEKELKKYPDMAARDRGFIFALVMHAMRNYGRLQDVAIALTDKKKQIKPTELRLVLVVALTQIVFMDVPNYAAVDTAMKLAVKLGLSRQKGFLNAVLRRATQDDQAEKLFKEAGYDRHYPQWLLEEWKMGYGDETLENIVNSLSKEPDLSICFSSKKCAKEYEKEFGVDLQKSVDVQEVGHAGLRLVKKAGGDALHVADLPKFESGSFWVQDASSAAPVSMLGDLKGKRVLDLCAAPGGKTMQLASQGAQVTAVDISEARMTRLRENLTRMKIEAEQVKIIVDDVLNFKTDDLYDVVLLDAPCTATGTIRRNPDVAMLRSYDQQGELIHLQAAMLDRCASFVAPGGFLLYCTCSLQKAEGEEQAQEFIEAQEGVFEYARFPECVDGADATFDKNGCMRLLPGAQPFYGDGFFAALLRRVA